MGDEFRYADLTSEYLHSKFDPDEDLDTPDGGWKKFYRSPNGGGRILHCDGHRFVFVVEYQDDSEAWEAWTELVDLFEPNPEEPADDDYVIDTKHYHVSQINRQFDTYIHALLTIRRRMDTDDFYPNVWLCDERGNLTCINLDEEIESADR